MLPAPYPFSSTDMGVHTFLVSLMTSGEQSITVTDESSQVVLGVFNFITVQSTGGDFLKVTGFPTPVTAGTPESFTVSMVNSSGSPVTTYTGTVHFTSTDPQAVLPANYTFTGADAGSHTFTGTLETAGLRSIIASDAGNCIWAYDSGIQVNAAAASSLVVYGYPSPVPANTSERFLVTAYDPYGNLATGYRGTVHFTSSDPLASLPANYTYAATDNGSHTFTASFNTLSIGSYATVDIAENNPSVYFLQGNVYNDLNGNNTYSPNDTPIVGETVKLYKSDGVTLLHDHDECQRGLPLRQGRRGRRRALTRLPTSWSRRPRPDT